MTTARCFAAGAALALALPLAGARGNSMSFNTEAGPVGQKWTVTERSGNGAGPTVTRQGLWIAATRLMTIPFTYNDGFWTADFYFTLPAGFSSPRMTVSHLVAKDRAVVFLNGMQILACGVRAPGVGAMQLTDPGAPVAFSFSRCGPIPLPGALTFVAGSNHIQVVMNHTAKGIAGGITPGGPAGFNLHGMVIYTAPAKAP